MSEFWGVDLGITLSLIHVPEVHCYYALGWQSSKLLNGIVGAAHYEEHLHERVLMRAQEYGLAVSTIESTDSMLRVVLTFDQQGKSIHR